MESEIFGTKSPHHRPENLFSGYWRSSNLAQNLSIKFDTPGNYLPLTSITKDCCRIGIGAKSWRSICFGSFFVTARYWAQQQALQGSTGAPAMPPQMMMMQGLVTGGLKWMEVD